MMNRLLAVLTLLFSLSITPAFAQTVEDGWKAYDVGDYEQAKSIFIPLAEAGNAKAMNAIGLMQDEGNAFPSNPELACDWYEKSAKAGYASGQNNIAVCFIRGEGRPTNFDKAIQWWERAAAQGHLDAQIALIANLRTADRNRAIYWGQKAVDAGSALGRVAMRGAKLPHTGPQASITDVACVIIMIEILGKAGSYCD